MESTIQQLTVYNLKREDVVNAVADYIKKVTNKEVDKKQLEWCGQNSSGGFDFQVREKLKVEPQKVDEKAVTVGVLEVPSVDEVEEEFTFIPPFSSSSVTTKLKLKKRA